MQGHPHPDGRWSGSLANRARTGQVYARTASGYPGGRPGGVYGGSVGTTGRASAATVSGRATASRGGRATASARPAPREPAGRPAGVGAREGRTTRPTTGRGRVRPGGRTTPAEPRPKTSNSRRRAPLWATFTVTVGVVLALLSGVALAGGNLLLDRYTGNIQRENLLGGAAAEPTEELDGPINILLLGTDARKNNPDDIRSDTIIVLHVPSTHDQAYLISVPRDSWVNVPGYGEMKITEAFYHGYRDGGGVKGGAQLIARTLNELSGLTFHGAAIISFAGFEKVIDEMGGVEFCITDPAVSEHYVMVNGERVSASRARREGLWPQEPIRYEEGCQRLAGWQALDYVRQRKSLGSGEGDYGRQRNQQHLLQAMMKQATSTDVRTNLAKLDGLLRAAGDTLIIDTNEIELLTFLFTLRNIRPSDLVSLRTNGGKFNSTTVNGQSVELLTPESLAMFQAAANDTMAEFVLSHPDFIDSE